MDNKEKDMKHLAIAMLLLMGGCVSVSAGRASSKDQQYPQWVLELAERRAEAQQTASGEAGSGSAGETEDDAEPVMVERPAASDARPAARKPRGEMNDREKIQEGVRLLREADAMRQRAAASHDAEEPRLNREKEALLRQRQQYRE